MLRFFLFQKSDPAQFLRIYGRPTKIHLDTAVALAAEAPQSMYVCQYFFLRLIACCDTSSDFL